MSINTIFQNGYSIQLTHVAHYIMYIHIVSTLPEKQYNFPSDGNFWDILGKFILEFFGF